MRAEESITRPVDFARLLTRHGVSLRRAHSTLQKIAQSQDAALELWCEDEDDLITKLASLGVGASVLKLPEVNVRDVRKGFGLSQQEFAVRFGFEPDTIQNWEQGRNSPDQATRLLLSIIGTRPDVVDQALAANAMGSGHHLPETKTVSMYKNAKVTLSPRLPRHTIAQVSTTVHPQRTQETRPLVEADPVVSNRSAWTNRPLMSVVAPFASASAA